MHAEKTKPILPFFYFDLNSSMSLYIATAKALFSSEKC